MKNTRPRLWPRARRRPGGVGPTCWLLVAALAAVASCACEGRSDPQPVEGSSVTQLTEPRKALSEQLMVSLGLARNFHHKADVYLKQGDMEAAIAAVQEILSIDFPGDSPEAEDVVLDARARLAKLLVTVGRVDEASAIVDEGIAGTRRESFFVANLHSVRGEIFEARAALAETDDPDAARQHKLKALESYDKAIVIEKALLESIAAGDGQ